jgi:hypothetical protein
MINARAISGPASTFSPAEAGKIKSRSIFYAYNDFARNIQRMQTTRVKIFLAVKNLILYVGKNKFLQI